MSWILGDGGGGGGRGIKWLNNDHAQGGGRGIKDLLEKLKKEMEEKKSEE